LEKSTKDGAKSTRFLANARGFVQLHGVLGKCTRFLTNARDFKEKHGVLDRSSRGGGKNMRRGNKIPGTGWKYAVFCQKFSGRRLSARFLTEVYGAETKIASAKRKYKFYRILPGFKATSTV
jgi:hypothetical protein